MTKKKKGGESKGAAWAPESQLGDFPLEQLWNMLGSVVRMEKMK